MVKLEVAKIIKAPKGARWINHLNKHGYNYTTEIIRECLSKEEVKEWGIYYSNLWNIVENNEWANLKEESGDGGNHGMETRRKMSESKKGTTPWNKGKTGIYSENTKKKISEAGIGRKHSEETKEKMANADRSTYKRVAPVSENTKKKLSEILKGKPGRATGSKWTTEQKESLSQKRIGRPCPTKGMKRVYRNNGTFYFEKI